MPVREARPEDGLAVLRLVAQLGYPVESEEGLRTYAAVLTDPANTVLIYEDDRGIQGLISLNIRPQLHHAAPVATIDEFVVDEARRGQGVGTALLEAAIAYCRQKGCVVIDVTSANHRQASIRWYVRRGFLKYGTKLVLVLE